MQIDLASLVIALIIGAIAGWGASRLFKKGPNTLIGYILVGVVGSFIGSFLIQLVPINVPGGPFVASLITAFLGAVVLLAILRAIQRK